MIVTPWSKEAEKIFRRMAKHGKAFTTNLQLPRSFSRRYPELTNKNNGLIGIYRSERRKESAFIPFDNVAVIPKPPAPSRNSKFMKFEIYRIF